MSVLVCSAYALKKNQATSVCVAGRVVSLEEGGDVKLEMADGERVSVTSKSANSLSPDAKYALAFGTVSKGMAVDADVFCSFEHMDLACAKRAEGLFETHGDFLRGN
ncbi:MAG: uncharacterized protein A8A55_1096 [Amphiamblys sp. WSBS2006]|nr:MAG: uncharacterized protein A8A55_1096 [Amphiamblys sp. WSBS2006]